MQHEPSSLQAFATRNPVVFRLGCLLAIIFLFELIPTSERPRSQSDPGGAASAPRSKASVGAGAPFTIDDATRCDTVVGSFDNNDRPKIFAIDKYVSRVMREQDREHVEAGERSVIAKLDHDGFVNLRTLAIAYCRQKPGSLLRDQAVDAYDGTRSLQDEFGIR